MKSSSSLSERRMCSESQSRSTVDNWAATHRDAARFTFLAQIIQAVDKMLVARIDRTVVDHQIVCPFSQISSDSRHQPPPRWV